jgi:hypothetical protein
MKDFECECFNKTPEFIEEDYSTCINCGKLFHYHKFENMYNNTSNQNKTNLKKNQQDLINAYIYNLQKNFEIKFKEKVMNDIIYLYNTSTETYKLINNYSKIKNNDNFCYLSCLYVFKNYNELNCINKLEKFKPKNINKFNKIFYLLCSTKIFKEDYGIKHDLRIESILYDDYSWLIYEILKKNEKLNLYENVYSLIHKKMLNDEFISKTNFEKYILKIISNS